MTDGGASSSRACVVDFYDGTRNAKKPNGGIFDPSSTVGTTLSRNQCHFDGAGDLVYFNDTDEKISLRQTDYTQDGQALLFIATANGYGEAGFGRIFEASTGGGFFLRNSSPYLRFNYVTTVDFTFQPSFGVKYIYGVMQDGSTGYAFIAEPGKGIIEKQSFTPTDSRGGGVCVGNRGAGDRAWDGTFELVLNDNQAWSDAKLDAFIRDPYGSIYRPAQNDPLWLGTAAAAASTGYYLPGDSHLASLMRGWPAPGVKPVCDVSGLELSDLGKQIYATYGLKVMITANGVARDIATNKNAVVWNPDVAINVYDGVQGARTRTANTTDEKVAFSNDIGPAGWSNDGSFMLVHAGGLDYNAHTLLMHKTGTYGVGLVKNGGYDAGGNSDGTLGVIHFGYAQYNGTISVDFANSGMHFVAANTRKNGTARLYFDGEVVEDISVGNYQTTTLVTNVIPMGQTGDNEFRGTWALAIITGKPLPDVLADSLARDPYQLLRPAQNDPLFIGTATAASTGYYLPGDSHLARLMRGWPTAPNARPADSIWSYDEYARRHTAWLLMPAGGAWKYYRRDSDLFLDFPNQGSGLSPVGYDAVHYDETVNAYCAIAATSETVHDGKITIVARIKVTDATNIHFIVGADSSASGLRDFQFRTTATDGYLQFIKWTGNSNTGGNLIGTKSVTDNSWHNVVVKYDGVRCKFWIDGILSTDSAMTGAIDSDNPSVVAGANFLTASTPSANLPMKGDMAFVALMDGETSDEFCRNASTDLFNTFFQPAQNDPLFIGSVITVVEGIPVLSNATWFNQQSNSIDPRVTVTF